MDYCCFSSLYCIFQFEHHHWLCSLGPLLVLCGLAQTGILTCSSSFFFLSLLLSARSCRSCWLTFFRFGLQLFESSSSSDALRRSLVQFAFLQNTGIIFLIFNVHQAFRSKRVASLCFFRWPVNSWRHSQVTVAFTLKMGLACNILCGNLHSSDRKVWVRSVKTNRRQCFGFFLLYVRKLEPRLALSIYVLKSLLDRAAYFVSCFSSCVYWSYDGLPTLLSVCLWLRLERRIPLVSCSSCLASVELFLLTCQLSWCFFHFAGCCASPCQFRFAAWWDLESHSTKGSWTTYSKCE